MIEYIYFVKCPNCDDEHFDFFDDAKSCAMSRLTQKPIITQVEVERNDNRECVGSSDLGTVWSWEDMMQDMPEENELTTFTKSETFDCGDDFFNCEFDDSLDTVPDNFRKPGLTEDAEFTDNCVYLDYGTKITKEKLYDLLVTQGHEVEVNIGDQEHYDKQFSDGSRYSDSYLTLNMNADGTFDVYEWDHSDDGDSTDGEFDFTSTSFDEFWDELVDYAPDCFINSSIRKPVPADMTIESLVEEMEEHEDTVECKVCEELYDKSSCRKDEKLGWVCEGCSGASHKVTESASLTEGVYDFPYLVNNPAAKQQILDELDLRIDTSRYVRGDAIQVQYEVKDAFSYPYYRNAGKLVDFNIGVDGKISVTLQDTRGSESEVDLQIAIRDAATVLNHDSASIVLKAIKDIATNINKANRPTAAQRAVQRAAAKDATILSMLQAEPAIAEEFRDHIESIKFSIPLGDYEYDIDFNEPDADRALARLNRTRDDFLALPFAQDAIACGMVDDRKLFDDAGNMLENNYGWVATYWYGSCAIKLDCQVGTLSNGAREVLAAAKNAGMITRQPRQDQNADDQKKKPKKKPEELDRFDGYVLAKALITFFNNDVEFFKKKGTQVATETITEALNKPVVDLEYENLTVEITTKYYPATWDSPADYEEGEYTGDFRYCVDYDTIAEALWDHFLTDEDAASVGGLEALEDDATWQSFLEANFESLVEKYYDQLLEYFREDAEEAAKEEFQSRYEDEMAAADEDARARWYDEGVEPTESGETLEESDKEFYDRLTFCPECGSERSFDRKAGCCLECKSRI